MPKVMGQFLDQGTPEVSIRACRASAESAVLSAFPTAFAPGIWEPANVLSFSLLGSSCFFAVSSVPHATATAERSARTNPLNRDDKNPPDQVGVLLVS